MLAFIKLRQNEMARKRGDFLLNTNIIHYAVAWIYRFSLATYTF